MTEFNKYQEDLNTPFTEKTSRKLVGHLNKKEAHQVTAVDATLHLWMADFDGQIGDAFVQAGTICAGAGESMSFDLQKNGVSILSAPIVLETATHLAAVLYEILSLIATANRSFVKGDVFTTVLDYTAGGGPTPGLNHKMVVEFSTGPYKE